jgi:NAD(P)-dependent dehydrogenase (short-subunit alcohol dehydrogenase family)
MKLAEKVAIVTGAASGIGRAIALALAREGANVVIGDIDLDGASKVADEIRALGHESIAVKADVSRSEEVNQMVEAAFEEFGRVDILVNNAGGSARERASLFKDSTENVWDFVIGRNLKGTMLCTRAVINHMLEKGTGRIINIASAAGVVGESLLCDYSAAKAGVIGFTKALAREVSPCGINVNCISPGVIKTKTLESFSEEKLEGPMKGILVGRLGKPEDIACMAVFLASDESSFITGQNHVVCGGGYIT